MVIGQPYYERQKSQGQRRVSVAGEAAQEPGGKEKPVGGGGGLAQVRVKQQELVAQEHAGDGQRRHREDQRHAEQRRAGPEVDDWEIETG